MTRFQPSVSFALLGVALFSPAAVWAADTTTFWIEPCTVMKAACEAGDADLARWALASWEAASSGRLHFVATTDRANGLIPLPSSDKASGPHGQQVLSSADT